MAFHPSQITRRNFVQRAGLLVSALGITGSVQSGLMDQILKKASRKWGREALAQAAPRVKFLVEICYRAGAQTNAMFPSQGHTIPLNQQNQKLNIYSSPGNIVALNRDGRDVYFARYTANAGADRLRQILANTAGLETVGVAQSEAIDLQQGNHTATFATRAPTGASVAPVVLHAATAPARPVQGIEWANGGGVNHPAGAYPALSRVNGRGQFQALFRELPMYFSKEELKLIVGSFDEAGNLLQGQEGTLHKVDAMWRATQDPRSGVYKDTDPVVVSSRGGRNQSTLSLIQALDNTYNQIAPNFLGTIGTANGGTPLGEALASAAAAFANGASGTFSVALNLGDHHSDIQARDTVGSKQGQMNIVHGNALAGLWLSAANLPDPDEPGKTVADSLLVKITSEFTRTRLRNGGGVGSDNGDGGTAGIVWMGKMIKNGSYGNIEGDSGALTGFNPVTGASGGSAPSEMSVYRTTLELLGQGGMAGAFGVAAAPVISAVIKP